MQAGDRRRDALSRFSAKAGFYLSVLAVFTCGWLATRAQDWKRIVLFTVLAGVAGLLASAFRARAG